MRTTKGFEPGKERYAFDFDTCSVSKGYAQVDTRNDAHYFGIWTNPIKMTTVTYCEGDVVIEQAESDKEYVDELRITIASYGDEFIGIDPGFNETLIDRFKSLGLGSYLH